MIKFSPIAFMVGFLGAYIVKNVRREKMSVRLAKLKIRFLKFKIRMNVGMMKRTAKEIQQLEIDRDRLIKRRRLDEWELKQAEEELEQ